jgi:hypothetical protein
VRAPSGSSRRFPRMLPFASSRKNTLGWFAAGPSPEFPGYLTGERLETDTVFDPPAVAGRALRSRVCGTLSAPGGCCLQAAPLTAPGAAVASAFALLHPSRPGRKAGIYGRSNRSVSRDGFSCPPDL